MSDTPAPKILVPTDFSDHAEHALAYAASLGERFGATLHLLHVLSPHSYAGKLDESALPDLNAQLDAADKAARQQMDAGAVHGGEAEADVVKVVKRRINAWEPILEYAEQEKIDLIIMAMRSGSTLARYLLGSVTERVLRFAPCPVLVVEKGDRDFVDPETMAVHLSKVVVADDLTDKSKSALAFAATWLKPYAPEIHLVHAVELEIPAPYVMAGVQSVFKLDPELRGRLDRMLGDHARASIPAEWTVITSAEEGLAHEQVPAYAAEVQADLLVVAGETHIDLKERVLGGTVERIARHAPCPMLVV